MLPLRPALFAAVLLTCLLVLLALPPGAAAQDEPPPEPPAEPELVVGFEPSALTVDGAPPEGSVVLFGFGRTREAYVTELRRFDALLTADAEGAARYALPEGAAVPQRSVWVVVDLGTGAYTVAEPEDTGGLDIPRIDFPARGLGANLRFLRTEGRYLDVLLVRPASGPEGEEAAGVWGLRTGDGGERDADGVQDGGIDLDVATLTALADSGPPPERLRPKDVLVGVNPETFELFATRLADAPEGAGEAGETGEAGGEG